MKRFPIPYRFLISFLASQLFGQQQPYSGSPWTIPGKIETENYDLGGEGTAYHDSEVTNKGGQYRSDGVDIETCGEGGYNIGWAEAGEWVEYTVNVAATGDYTLRFRVASQETDGGTFRIAFNGVDALGIVHAPNTGAWQTYAWIVASHVRLNAGIQVMRINVEYSYYNLNSILFEREYNTVYPSVNIVSPMDVDILEKGQTIRIIADALDTDGTIQKVAFYNSVAMIGEDTASPYEIDWTPVSIGNDKFYAVATDNVGASTTSDTVSIQIKNPKLPDNPNFSVAHGFFDKAFNLVVSWDSAGSVIRYTLDGSDPLTNSAASEKASPATIRIDPASTAGRALTPAVVVRAYALVGGAAVTDVGANTYIFTPQVKIQTYPGGDWPQPGNVYGRLDPRPRTIDYDMDPNVVNNVRYKNLVSGALTAIPSVCINTELENLFDYDNGIYVNPQGRDYEWERPASIELIDPNFKEEGFQINAGLRIRGGYSRIGDQPKQAFRFFFRDEYGKKKLNYPLFGDEGVSSFECVDLRTAQNYSWSYYGNPACIFIRDVFSRDCQRDMGWAYTRSRAYHLYLNGMYWGLYQTEERPEAAFAESYFGGDKDNYDVVKVDVTNNYSIEATDGYTDAFNSLWEACQSGLGSNAGYFEVQGKNPDGTINWDYPVLVDPINLIDYLLIIYYTGNYDSPVSAFLGNSRPNNFFGIYDRIGRTGFQYFVHDAEHTMLNPSNSDLNWDTVNDRTGPFPAGSEQSSFNPQWLHQKLSENAEYRTLFADRVYRAFFNKGPMTVEVLKSRLQDRADEIDMAVIAESARWGDSKAWPARTKDDDWLPAVNWIKNQFFTTRIDIVLNQVKAKNLYPNLNPPVFLASATEILENVQAVSLGASILLLNNNASKTGSIVYTTDGSDPRAIGGANSATARDGGDETSVSVNANTVLKARVKNGSVWSALHEIILNTGLQPEGLKVTEVHYHPLPDGDVDGEEFEFVEFKNVGVSGLSLSGARFVQGIEYQFPDGFTLASGGFAVLASNTGMFHQRYGFSPSGEFERQLDNGGERVTLVDVSGDTILTFHYKDGPEWPQEPDTAGYSLVSVSLKGIGEPDSSDYWRASHDVHGSPGADDLSSGVEVSQTTIPSEFILEQNYPNPFNPSTEIRFSLPWASQVRLKVFDVIGREIAILADGRFNAGNYSVRWNAGNMPAGIYFSLLEADGIRLTRKMMLLK